MYSILLFVFYFKKEKKSVLDSQLLFTRKKKKKEKSEVLKINLRKQLFLDAIFIRFIEFYSVGQDYNVWNKINEKTFSKLKYFFLVI